MQVRQPGALFDAASQRSLHAHVAASEDGTHTLPNVLGRRTGPHGTSACASCATCMLHMMEDTLSLIALSCRLYKIITCSVQPCSGYRAALCGSMTLWRWHVAASIVLMSSAPYPLLLMMHLAFMSPGSWIDWLHSITRTLSGKHIAPSGSCMSHYQSALGDRNRSRSLNKQGQDAHQKMVVHAVRIMRPGHAPPHICLPRSTFFLMAWPPW